LGSSIASQAVAHNGEGPKEGWHAFGCFLGRLGVKFGGRALQGPLVQL
jgi:hypothetical protein